MGVRDKGSSLPTSNTCARKKTDSISMPVSLSPSLFMLRPLLELGENLVSRCLGETADKGLAQCVVFSGERATEGEAGEEWAGCDLQGSVQRGRWETTALALQLPDIPAACLPPYPEKVKQNPNKSLTWQILIPQSQGWCASHPPSSPFCFYKRLK